MATMIDLTCKFCGKNFSVKKGRECMFCCKACKLNYRKQNDEIFYIEKPCECCGKIFKSKKKWHKKYCSYKCAGIGRTNNAREIRYCLECGKSFDERKKRIRSFCSEQCRVIWQAKPENIQKRMNKTKEAVMKKYGVENVFQVKEIREKAHEKVKEIYKLHGSEITENALIKIKENRNNKLIKRFDKIGYNILEFKGENLVIMHPDGHVFENNRKLLVSRLNHNVELSTTLQPIGASKSTFELRICDFLKEHNIEHIPNDKSIIRGDIDIYIPKHKLAIECDGLHWHSEYYRENNYHLNKTIMCENIGIQLLHFYEDEYIENFDIIKSIIKSKLGIINNKIFARKCEIKEIDPKVCTEFLIHNHIQGNVNSLIKLGLYYNNELVSVMTFGHLRNVLGNNKVKNNNEYEMLRFCNKLDTQVIGGASKLYHYFKLKYKPHKVISFASKRYSNGNLYEKLGFKFIENTVPNYWYVVGKHRMHRFKYRKDVLVKKGFDPNKTEHEIMLERKIPRIYDCGSIKYEDIVIE